MAERSSVRHGATGQGRAHLTWGNNTPPRWRSIQSSCPSSMSPGLLCSVSVLRMVASRAVRSQFDHVLTLGPALVSVTRHCSASMARCCGATRVRAHPPRGALALDSRESRMSTLAADAAGVMSDEPGDSCDATASLDWPEALPVDSRVLLGAGRLPSLAAAGAAGAPAVQGCPFAYQTLRPIVTHRCASYRGKTVEHK